MKISLKQLKEMIDKEISGKSDKQSLKEGAYFQARRRALLKAKEYAFDFEKEIQSHLELDDPDNLTPELQKEYYLIVNQLSHAFVKAANEAMAKLSRSGLPKKKEEPKEPKKSDTEIPAPMPVAPLQVPGDTTPKKL